MRLLTVLSLLAASAAGAGSRPRLVVLTDIGGDPDDQQAMVRLMAFANQFEIEGLIASASGIPGELKRNIVQPQLIREIVEAYGKVRANLARHEPSFPTAERLLAVIKSGDPNRDVRNLGENSDTEGSRWIVSVVDRPDPRPVNIAVWGGAHDLAQALWRVRHDRTAEETRRFVSKLRVHSIGHQDNTGPWILEHFPALFFILSSSDAGDVLGDTPGKGDRRLSTYRGMYLGGDESLTSLEWLDRNVRTGHGPLGALYPPKTWTAPNPHGALKEGDTPSWFYFLPNGLSDAEHPEWGSWGGRFRAVRDRYYSDAEDRVGEVQDARAAVWRWREAFQNAFAARMDWCVESDLKNANHPPVAVLNGDRTQAVLRVTARPGGEVRLSARGSSDPDGGTVSYRWFHYPEAGGSGGVVLEPKSWDSETLVFAVPKAPTPADVHIVLEVRDSGTPALTSYRRAIVRCEGSREK